MPVVKANISNFARTLVPNAEKRSRMSNLLLASMLGYGITAGALVAGALAASVLPAQTPLTQSSLIMIKTGDTSAMETALAQPMPPMPDQEGEADRTGLLFQHRLARILGRRARGKLDDRLGADWLCGLERRLGRYGAIHV